MMNHSLGNFGFKTLVHWPARFTVSTVNYHRSDADWVSAWEKARLENGLTYSQNILDRRETGGADETIGGQLRALKQAFGLQKAVPVPDFPKIPKGKARDVLISPAEQKRLVPAITDECYCDAVDFKFATGWRGNEVRTLQWKYVWPDAGVIHFAEPYSTTGETRDHPLTGIVADIIDRWETKRVPVCPFVFHRKEGPLSYKSLERAWQQAACSIGLGSIDRTAAASNTKASTFTTRAAPSSPIGSTRATTRRR